RGPDGNVLAVVEEAQATPEQKEIRELNASVYCFEAGWLWPALDQIEKSPKGEYYLTDIVAVAARAGLAVKALVAEDPAETIGINNRAYLAEAEAILRRRINNRWMDAGVTLVDPQTTYIEPAVTIGQDTVIYPNTHLRGQTVIGSDCAIGPNTILTDTRIGNACTITVSVLIEAIVEDEAQVGPFAYAGSGAQLAAGAGETSRAGAAARSEAPPDSTAVGGFAQPNAQQDKGER
ncbi:MAG TPA: hypothetical protein VFF68_11465, partial [Anaerolineaceae bacterium]|nr:hypothetical protein [Anaerolineaceae bacterium]